MFANSCWRFLHFAHCLYSHLHPAVFLIQYTTSPFFSDLFCFINQKKKKSPSSAYTFYLLPLLDFTSSTFTEWICNPTFLYNKIEFILSIEWLIGKKQQLNLQSDFIHFQGNKAFISLSNTRSLAYDKSFSDTVCYVWKIKVYKLFYTQEKL